MDFNETKEWFLKMIETKKTEIKNVSGIYMLYIQTNKEMKNIIPFYIGKSVNVLSRYNQHKSELKKLINLYTSDFDKKTFYLHFHQSKQSGKHLYSKIFYFLKDNNLTIDNLKIIILEIAEHNLENKEKEWIHFTNSFLFGFNQFPFISQSYAVIKNEEIKGFSLQKDIELLLELGIITLDNFDITWLDYGYNIFNIHEFVKFGLIQIDRFKIYNNLRKNKYNQELLDEFKNKFLVFCNFWKEINIKYDFEF